MVEPELSSLPAIFKAYDVRGTVPDQLDDVLVERIGAAFARFVGRGSRRPVDAVLVGRDMRPSGVELARPPSPRASAARASTSSTSGLASTDLRLLRRRPLDAPGAMFTASHNPAQYNGIKLCLAGARPVGEDTGLVEIRDLAVAGVGPARHHGHASAERDAARRRSPPTSLASSTSIGLTPLKIVADTANGMGGLVVPGGVRRPAVRPRDHVRRARRHVPEPPGRPDPAREPARPRRPGCSRPAPTSAWPSTATPTACSSSTTRAQLVSGSTHDGDRRRRHARRSTRARRSSTT